MSRRSALIDAAKHLLWQRGYAATSQGAILERSRSGQGSLHHFFDGKEDLAAAALHEVEAEVSSRLEATCGPGTGRGMERLERFLLAERDALRGCRLGRLAQDPELPERLRLSLVSGFERVLAVVEGAIEDAKAEGDLPAGIDARTLAASVVAVVQGGYVLARAQQRPANMTDAVRGLAALLGIAGGALPVRRSKRASTGKGRHA
jgi:TetR/AcrR family transcriptional regulator, transcriptional repressor for nem operon